MENLTIQEAIDLLKLNEVQVQQLTQLLGDATSTRTSLEQIKQTLGTINEKIDGVTTPVPDPDPSPVNLAPVATIIKPAAGNPSRLGR